MAIFVMAGGGSGGHVIPALAVARELRARRHAAQFIGTRRGIEARLVPAAGFPIDWIEVGGLKRVGVRKTLSTLAALPGSVVQAARLLHRANPAAVFSTGGYVAGPVLLAALWMRIPVVVMEPNAVPGFTHRRVARFVARALVSFQETARWFPPGRAELTGLPVREEFFALPPPVFEEPLTVLITGGSQGSRVLNRAAEQSWPLWRKDSVRLIQQTGWLGGLGELEHRRERFRVSGVPGEIDAFLDDMPAMFAQAGLIVSRAGMGAVSEIAASGRPSILVPLSTASDQHQLRNAEALVKAGAAVLVTDAELSGARLVAEVIKLIDTPGKLEAMGKAARAFARPGAAGRAAEILESFAPGRD